jgi:hypothetical protein
MENKILQKGTVIQITENHKWCGCLAMVSEPKGWGCQAFINIPEQGNAYIRLNFEDFEVIGIAPLIPKD